MLNHVLSCSMLVFALMMAVVAFHHGAVIMFVFAKVLCTFCGTVEVFFTLVSVWAKLIVQIAMLIIRNKNIFFIVKMY